MHNLLRAKHAAQYLGVAKSTFWRWVKEGKIPQGIHLGSRVTVWKKDVLDKLLSTHENKGGELWRN